MLGDDLGGIFRAPGGRWVWVPPWLPPGLGLGKMQRDPLLVYLDAVRASLEDRSEESFRKALASEQHLAAIASLHASCNCAGLEESLESLQQELHRPGAATQALLHRIATVLRQKAECGCG